jgi:cation transport ATPase
MGTEDGQQHSEDKKERVNRELIELLNELRVALPGVQVLFAFMLIVPFSQGFARVTTAERFVYFVAFLCAAMGTGLLIAPSSYHRLRFRHRDKERMLLSSNRMAIAGMAFVALSIAAVVALITDVIFNTPAAVAVAIGIGGWFAWFWYGLPLSRRLQDESE